MKRSAIAGLFVTAAMLASPVFAADKDLCTSNIEQIKQVLASDPTSAENSIDNIKESLKRAEDAQKAGDDKKCISETTKTLERIQTRNPANKG